ncbi:MAG: DMT family transporter [Bacteroidaceae bacterium]|nr:DMT family transporter [Bacteroidaceae bacterium]
MERVLYHIVAFWVVAVWGVTFVFTKLLLMDGLTAAQIFVLRFIVAYVLLLGYSLTQKRFRLMAGSWKDELLMVSLGVTGGSLYFLTENSAMIYTTTTNTSLIVCLCPLFAALLVALFYRSERLHGIQIVGTLIAAVGVVVVVLNGQFVLHLSPLGDALAFAACLCWAMYSLLMIPATRRYNTVFITRKVFFYGLLSMIPYFLIRTEEASFFNSSILQFFNLKTTTLLNLLFLGCVASMLCFLTWNWVMKKLGAVVVTNYVYFNPVTTVIFAWLMLSERITIYFIIGTILILAGMYLCNKRVESAKL